MTALLWLWVAEHVVKEHCLRQVLCEVYDCGTDGEYADTVKKPPATYRIGVDAFRTEAEAAVKARQLVQARLRKLDTERIALLSLHDELADIPPPKKTKKV